MDVGSWLRDLGLGQYEQAFLDNAVDGDILAELTDADLSNLGIVLGHRKRILKAIAALASSPAPVAQEAPERRALSSSDEAERRQLTVMFCDIVGSTAMSARLDPEDMRRVIGSFRDCVRTVCSTHDGFVAKYMGDGALIYFGYPQAFENDAERALRAGLALIEAIGARQGMEPIKLRVGVATGLVVVGDIVGSGEAQERGVVGETPNVAARLQAAAEPNTILICENTRQLTAGLFDYRELGPIEAKGFADPLKAWRVVGESTVTSRFEALRVRVMPLVGRQEEIDLLKRRWAQVCGGEGRVALISGEPGIGKSRLTAALREHVNAGSRICLQYFCAPHMSGSVLYPIFSQIEHAAGIERSDTAEAKLEKLEKLFAQSSSNVSQDVGLVADFLSIAADTRYPKSPHLSGQKRKELMLDRLVAQLEGLARTSPVLAIFEDVQWMDATSLELLDLTVRRIEGLPILAVVTYRPDFVPPWIGQPHVSVLTLSRLTRNENAAMLERLTAGRRLPPELVEQILTRTDGVPLFVEELTRSVLESGILHEVADELVLSGPLPALAVPASLQASLAARLDRLAPARNVAQIGAALGREFTYEVLREAADLPESELRSALDRLVGAEILHRRGTLPDTIFTFKHALVQDAAYETLLRSQRAAIHGRICNALERKFPEIASQHPEIVAHHAAEAGMWEQAIRHRLAAARRALARSAAVEARAQIERAQPLIDSLEPGEARDRLDYQLKLYFVDALKMLKGLMAPDAGAILSGLRDHPGRQPGSVDDLRSSCGLWSYFFLRAEIRNGLMLSNRLLSENSDGSRLAIAHYMRGSAAGFLGDIADGREHLERCVQLSRAPEFASIDYILGYKTEVDALVRVAILATGAGLIDQGRQLADLAMKDARRSGHPFTLDVLLVNVSRIYWMLGDVDRVATLASEGALIASEQRFDFYTARCDQLLGWVDVMRGSVAGGLERMERGLATARRMGARLWDAHLLPVMASCHLRAGGTARAVALLDEAFAELAETEEYFWLAEAHRVRGEVAQATGADAAAEEHYRRAADVARSQGALLWELRATTHLARLLLAFGRGEEASAALSPVLASLKEGLDTPDAIGARHALMAARGAAAATGELIDGATQIEQLTISGNRRA